MHAPGVTVRRSVRLTVGTFVGFDGNGRAPGFGFILYWLFMQEDAQYPTIIATISVKGETKTGHPLFDFHW
jgi:hypothetical protein